LASWPCRGRKADYDEDEDEAGALREGRSRCDFLKLLKDFGGVERLIVGDETIDKSVAALLGDSAMKCGDKSIEIVVQ